MAKKGSLSERLRDLMEQNARGGFPDMSFLDEAASDAPPASPAKPDSGPVNQTVNQTVDQQAERQAPQPDNQPEPPSQGRPRSRTEKRSARPAARQTKDQTTSHTQDQSFSLPPSPAADHTPSHTPIFSSDHAQDQAASHTPALPFGRTTVADRLNANQKKVLSFLLETRPYIVKYRDLSHALAMPEASVRTVLRRLAALDFIAFRKARDGNIQGVTIRFHQDLCDQFREGHVIGQTESLTWSQPHSLSFSPPRSQTFDQSFSQPMSRPVNRSANQTANLERQREESFFLNAPEGAAAAGSAPQAPTAEPAAAANPAPPPQALSPNRSGGSGLPDFSAEDIAFYWPALSRIGFGADQLRQVVERLSRIGKTSDLLVQALTYANWELEQGPLKDAKGQEVESPLGYLFAALAKTGYYRRPRGYVSPEEQAEQDRQEELDRLVRSRTRTDEMRFEAWKAALAPEELAEIMKHAMGPRDAWLKSHWQAKVKQP